MTTPDFCNFEKAIHKYVDYLACRYGSDYDELFSEAQWLFLKAVKTYDSTRGACFKTHLYNVIKNGLISYQRRRHYISSHEHSFFIDSIPKHDRIPWLSDFLDGLSDAAYEVALLVLEPPADVLFGLCENKRHSGKADTWRASVYSLLRDLGWTPKEISIVFSELATALEDYR